MKTYRVIIRFKNGKVLDFSLDSEDDLRDTISNAMSSHNKILNLADYIIAREEIAWIKIEGGEILEESSGK